MLLTQYYHRLPIDHNMLNIRNRALSGGPKWDNKPGLAFKVFALQERNQYAAVSNAYSSLYLWLDTTAAAEFLWSDGFQNVCDTFGRPAFETWMVVDASRGPSCDAAYLYRDDADVKPGYSIADLKGEETDWTRQTASRPETMAAIVGLDVSNWRRSRFHLSTLAPEEGENRLVFQVGYLAKPGMAQLKRI